MGTVNVTAKHLQMAGPPSVPYAPTLSTPTGFSGGDRVVVKPPAAHSLTPERMLLRVTNADTAAHTITSPVGDPVLGAGRQRPSSWPIGASSVIVIGPLDSSVVTQADGTVALDFEAGHSGTVEALLLPKGA